MNKLGITDLFKHSVIVNPTKQFIIIHVHLPKQIDQIVSVDNLTETSAQV